MRFTGLARLVAGTPLAIFVCTCTATPGPAPTADTAEPGLVADLAADFAQARSRVEVTALDVGYSDHEKALGRGWSATSETWGDTTASERTIRWALGGRAEIEIFRGRDSPLRMRLLAQPIWFDDAPAQQLAIDVDGEPAGSVTLPQGMGWTDATVSFSPGAHIVGLTSAWSRRPREVHPGATDDRDLAAAFDRIEFPDARPRPSPALISDDGERRLRLPIPSQVDYELALPAGALLRAARITGPEAALAQEASLELEIEPRGQGRVRWRLAPGTDPLVHDLGLAQAGWVRVSLRARDGRDGTREGSAFEIVEPRIVAAATPVAASPRPVASASAAQAPPRRPAATSSP